MCQEHLVQVQKQLENFKKKNVEIKVISFASVAALKQFQEDFHWKVPLYSDPEKKLYRHFGFKVGKMWDIFHPKTIAAYAKYLASGYKSQKAKQDIYQLGGDIILNAKGEVIYRYASKRPDDRPSVEELLSNI